ncbi:glycosyltransferase family 4 protein [Coraliomargarita algicola]|uniref:Glycosyltransferase family 4 protein n=1 Tax=Coraliomargarita algicola TaxID=3092156 RepID=A0ABZ0RJ70_9BACT|nr:glycosyltransferase family 4 protein [Coraliomargarita sp. J2-16]WPJ95020.1 glycosyltransferase family 4 protein [Coraliomargarita sp. J2-16]
MPKKFLIISQVFPPDPAAVGQYFDEAAQALRAAGHEVTILTANRGYDDPEQKFEAFENRSGVAVRRLPASSFGKASMPVRIFGQLSFLLQCIVRGLFQRGLTDLLVSTSPPMCGIVAVLIGWLRPSVKVHYWVMDLNPDQAVALEVFQPKHPLVKAMDWLNRRILKRASSVIALDRFMAARLRVKLERERRALAVERSRITVIPPWPMGQHAEAVAHAENPFRKEHGWADRFVVMFSGNHSWVHPLGTILDAAEQLAEDPRFVFVFIGGGKGKAEVDERIERWGHLEAGRARPAVVSLPYQPLEVIRYSLSAADLHLVSLGDHMGGIVHPCKVYGALAMARPVLTLGPQESYLNDILSEDCVGWSVAHGDVAGAVQALQAAADLSSEARSEMGARARAVVAQKFNREQLLQQFTDTVLWPADRGQKAEDRGQI